MNINLFTFSQDEANAEPQPFGDNGLTTTFLFMNERFPLDYLVESQGFGSTGEGVVGARFAPGFAVGQAEVG